MSRYNTLYIILAATSLTSRGSVFEEAEKELKNSVKPSQELNTISLFPFYLSFLWTLNIPYKTDFVRTYNHVFFIAIYEL